MYIYIYWIWIMLSLWIPPFVAYITLRTCLWRNLIKLVGILPINNSNNRPGKRIIGRRFKTQPPTLDLSHGKVVMINRQLEATLAKPVRMKQYVEQYWCTWKVVYSYTIRFASYPLIPSSFMFYHYIHMYLHTSNIFFQLPKEKKKESTFACQEIGTLSIKFYPTICNA